MKKLSKTDIEALSDIADEVRQALEEANAELGSARSKVAEILSGLSAPRERAACILSDAAVEASEYFDERSEKWQESDRGESYANWRDELERLAAEIEDIEPPEFDDIEEPGWLGEIQAQDFAEWWSE